MSRLRLPTQEDHHAGEAKQRDRKRTSGGGRRLFDLAGGDGAADERARRLRDRRRARPRPAHPLRHLHRRDRGREQVLREEGLEILTGTAPNALAGEHRRYSLTRVPGAIFTDPEIASVGLTAEEAQAQGRKVKVGKQEMTKVGRARAMGETEGFVKFVVDADSDELLGMHVLAYHGADLLAQGVIAMNGTGTLAPLLDCVCIHPTLSEGVKAAAGNLQAAEIPDTAGDLPVR